MKMMKKMKLFFLKNFIEPDYRIHTIQLQLVQEYRRRAAQYSHSRLAQSGYVSDEAKEVLSPGRRKTLKKTTKRVNSFLEHFEMPLNSLFQHGDVHSLGTPVWDPF